MKYYIVQDLNDPSKIKVERRSNGNGTLGEAPIDSLTGDPESGEWLVLVDGSYVVDKAAKKTKIAEIKANRQAIKKQRDDLKDLKVLFKDFKKEDLTDLSEVQDAIDNIITYIKLRS